MLYRKLAIITLFFLISSLSFSQQITVIPEGNIQKGDSVEVTGDYVRIRTGPSLEYRIITKVNRCTKATVLDKGEKKVKIEQKDNYWYKIRVTETGIEGWIFGAYLKKIPVQAEQFERTAIFNLNQGKENTSPAKEGINQKKDNQTNISSYIDKKFTPDKTVFLEKNMFPPSKNSYLLLEEIGKIPGPALQITAGDLNQNGVTEVILMKKDKQDKYNLLIGYEFENKNFKEVYSIKININRIEKIRIFEENSLPHPILALSSERITYLMAYEIEKNRLSPMGRVNAPDLALGYTKEGAYFLVYPKKNKIRDNDNTITYYLQIEKVEISRSRVLFREKIQYLKPLPVKKILTMDIDGDTNSDIITEIGGGDSGGGITVLSFNGEVLTRVHNTGFNTYNQNPFIEMWNLHDEKLPLLVLYTTDPFSSNDINTSFGFVYTSVLNGRVNFLNFYPVNKMLDDKNNYRKIVYFPSGENNSSFLIFDLNQETSIYNVNQVLFPSKSF